MTLFSLWMCVVKMVTLFFFQAEDGIRYYKVTGVQTCALPICPSAPRFGRYVGCPQSCGRGAVPLAEPDAGGHLQLLCIPSATAAGVPGMRCSRWVPGAGRPHSMC